MASRDQVYIDIIAETKKSAANFAKLAAGVTAAVLAVKKIAQAINQLENIYAAQLQAETKLAAALKATGNVVGITATEMKRFASEMQKTTVFGDEMIIEAQALMTTFRNISGEVFPNAITAAADMSSMLGTDLQSSVIQLGKALNDPVLGVTALNRIGVTFTQDQRDTIKTLVEMNDTLGAQKIILAEVNGQLGGTAKAMGETAAAAKTQLNNALGDLKESFGQLITEGLEPSRRKMTAFVESVTEAIRFMRILNDVTADSSILDPAKSLDEQASELTSTLDTQREALAGVRNQLENWGDAGNIVTRATYQLKEVLEAVFPVLGDGRAELLLTREQYERLEKEIIGNIAITERQVSGIKMLIGTTEQLGTAIVEESEDMKAAKAIYAKYVKDLEDIDYLEARLGDAYNEKAEKLEAARTALSGFMGLQTRYHASIENLTDVIIELTTAEKEIGKPFLVPDAWAEYQTQLRQVMEELGLIIPMGKNYTAATDEAATATSILGGATNALRDAIVGYNQIIDPAIAFTSRYGGVVFEAAGMTREYVDALLALNEAMGLADTANALPTFVDLSGPIDASNIAIAQNAEEWVKAGVAAEEYVTAIDPIIYALMEYNRAVDAVVEQSPFEKLVAGAEDYALAWTDAFQLIGGMHYNLADEMMDASHKLYEANRDAANATTMSERNAAAERAQIAADEYEEIYERRVRLLNFQKAAALVEIAIKTAAAIVDALAEGVGPTRWIEAGAVAAAGFAQTGNVLAQQIPALASGGIVRRPTVALIGERGPEAVVPLGRNSGTRPIVINVHGSVVSEDQLRGFVANTMAMMGRGY